MSEKPEITPPEQKEKLFPKELPKSEPPPEPKSNKEELSLLRTKLTDLESSITEIKNFLIPKVDPPPTEKPQEKPWQPWDLDL